MEEKKKNQIQADDCDAAIKTAQFRFAPHCPACAGACSPMGAIRHTSCASQRTRLLYPTADV